MPRKKTPEEYYNDCKEKGLDLPIEDYKGSKVKIKHKCKNGHIYEQTPTHNLSGIGCHFCNGGIKYTPSNYINECKKRKLDLPIEDYIDSNTKIKHRCKNGHIYEQRPSSHLRGNGCRYCANNVKKTTEEYIRECKERGYDLPVENYQGDSIAIKHKCNHGHIYKQTPNAHLRGEGCSECRYTKFRFNTDTSYSSFCKKENLDIPVSKYKNQLTKIIYKCPHGHFYKQSPSQHKYYGCSVCKESHGEKFIRVYLDKRNIKYEAQKRFNDLKDRAYLSYDFYLPEYNILIEYQGKQHYENNGFFGGEEQFKKQQYHDRLKKEYAKKNHYKLLELHYSLDTQDKVDKYLNRRIKG